MPSQSDFDLGPDAPESERRPSRRYDEESGARPLPSEAYEPFDNDDVVELPARSNPVTLLTWNRRNVHTPIRPAGDRPVAVRAFTLTK